MAITLNIAPGPPLPSLMMERLYQAWPERDIFIGYIVLSSYSQEGPWAAILREGGR